MTIRPMVISRLACGNFFMLAGLWHFAQPDIFLCIMPAYIPYPLECVYLSGTIELAAGSGLLWSRTRLVATWLLLALLVAVFPANINMALHPELFPDLPTWLLYARLPLQPLLMVWVWNCRNND
jgi:uncharacterized membrane protein